MYIYIWISGSHTPGRRGGATTVDSGRDRRGGGPSACQTQEGTRSRWDTEQCVDNRTSGQSRGTRHGVQPSVEERSIPYPMEGGSAGATAKTWQTSRGTASFRPLCMLDTFGKIFEQVIAERLRKHFRGKYALSADQYGFRAGCSTINAARRLKKLAASAIKEHQFGAAISLDIQNAFNSMLWMRILEALANTEVPVYLRNIIRDYFQDLVVFAQTASGMVRK